jgi:hypothetical protein
MRNADPACERAVEEMRCLLVTGLDVFFLLVGEEQVKEPM